MPKNLFDNIPEKILRALAKEKGYFFKQGESIDEIKKWLLTYYRRGVDEISGKGGNILEIANDALRRFRSAIGIPTQEPQAEESQQEAQQADAFSTATMANIYEKQGLDSEALAIYKKLLKRDPDNPQWRSAVERLAGKSQTAEPGSGEAAIKEEEKDSAPSIGANTISGEHVSRKEPYFLLDMEELPGTYGKDSMVLMAVGPGDLYAFWEVTRETYNNTLAAAGSEGTLVLRLFEVALNEESIAEAAIRDETVHDLLGEYFVHGVKPGGFYRFALGIKAAGKFHPLVHSELEATAATGQSELREEEWMELDQKKLLWRSREAAELNVEKKLKLSLREKALLRLHALGKYKGSRLSGIPEDRLEELFGSIRDLAGDVGRADVSSPGWDGKNEE